MAGNGKMIVTEAAFKALPLEDQLWITYSTIISHDTRIGDLENRKIIDRLYAFGGGIIGGVIAFWMNLLGGGGGTPAHP